MKILFLAGFLWILLPKNPVMSQQWSFPLSTFEGTSKSFNIHIVKAIVFPDGNNESILVYLVGIVGGWGHVGGIVGGNGVGWVGGPKNRSLYFILAKNVW